MNCTERGRHPITPQWLLSSTLLLLALTALVIGWDGHCHDDRRLLGLYICGRHGSDGTAGGMYVMLPPAPYMSHQQKRD
jgi:hypothetical protein